MCALDPSFPMKMFLHHLGATHCFLFLTLCFHIHVEKMQSIDRQIIAYSTKSTICFLHSINAFAGAACILLHFSFLLLHTQLTFLVRAPFYEDILRDIYIYCWTLFYEMHVKAMSESIAPLITNKLLTPCLHWQKLTHQDCCVRKGQPCVACMLEHPAVKSISLLSIGPAHLVMSCG